MILLPKIKYSIKINEVWFANQPYNKGDIVRYKSARFPLGKIIKNGRTFINDLTQPEEELFNSFDKGYRYEIRRAQREGVKTSIFTSHEISDSMLIEYINYFRLFHESKGLPNEDKDKFLAELIQLRNNNAFVLSQAMLDDKVVVYHTYFVDEAMCCLKESASLFRLEENIPKKMVGMANRFLHYEDMLYFKGIGKTSYDWGGAGTNDSVKSITEFKEKFGGVPIDTYDSVVSRTIKGKLANFIFQILRKN